MDNLYFTTAILQRSVEAEGDAPTITVFTFPSDEGAEAFRSAHNWQHDKEIMRADDIRIPPFGTDGVQYEPHGFKGGFGIEPAALVPIPSRS